jgi:hypothetical protein
MPIRRELYEEMAERHEREHRVDSWARRWFWVRTACWCWVWAILGLVPAGWAFRVTDVELGRILLDAAYVVTIAGVLGTLGRAVVVAERRGWL